MPVVVVALAGLALTAPLAVLVVMVVPVLLGQLMGKPMAVVVAEPAILRLALAARAAEPHLQ
jgi:Na+/H+ antiporter NhaA